MTKAEIAEKIAHKFNIFGIRVAVAEILEGASVTRYIFDVLSEKTRMSEFQMYAEDIRAAAESQHDVRIVAPLVGTSQIAVEVANEIRDIVTLDAALESEEFRMANGLSFVLGENVSRHVVVADLAKLPHLLVAGTTGSGKSHVLHNLILSLAHRLTPDQVRFLLVDSRMVEFSCYNDMPHLLTTNIITEHGDTLAALDYLREEMERRYNLFVQNNARDLSSYNSVAKEKLPNIVLVIDEIADIVCECKKDFETKLMRLVQKSRAAGILVVLATQRPDVNVISGTIKANLPARVALRTASQIDSMTILNGSGAEKLVGYGDMLFQSPYASAPERIQGAYASYEEICSIAEQLKQKYPHVIDGGAEEKIFVSRKGEKQAEELVADPLCKKALRYWLEQRDGIASIVTIQRDFKIGFNRSGRIMDYLQKKGYVEEYTSDFGRKPLHVLVSVEDLDKLFPDLED